MSLQQVIVMRHLYSQADNVLTQLDEKYSNTRNAFESIWEVCIAEIIDRTRGLDGHKL